MAWQSRPIRRMTHSTHCGSTASDCGIYLNFCPPSYGTSLSPFVSDTAVADAQKCLGNSVRLGYMEEQETWQGVLLTLPVYGQGLSMV